LAKGKLLERLLSDWPAKALSLMAALLLFFFQTVNRLEERPLSVPLSVVAARDFVPASAYPRTVRLILRGESNAVHAILENDLEASADFSGFDSEGSYRVSIQVAKKGSALGIDPLEIRVEPPDVEVRLERRDARSVPVVPVFRGFLDPGYELASWSIEPRTVEVTGPESLVAKAVDVGTEYVELSGRSQDFTTAVRLARRDSLLEVVGPETVQFSAVVRRATASRSFEGLGIAATGLDPAFALAAPLSGATLRVAGPRELVDAWEPGPAALFVDLSEVADPGAYARPILVELPEGMQAEAWSPQSVELVVVAAGGGGR
jgi:YbbR domain-containing protein